MMRSRFEPATFRFTGLPEQEADTLLIQLALLVWAAGAVYLWVLHTYIIPERCKGWHNTKWYWNVPIYLLLVYLLATSKVISTRQGGRMSRPSGSRCLGDQGIETSWVWNLVELKQWLHNLYIYFPSQALDIIRVGRVLVDPVSG